MSFQQTLLWPFTLPYGIAVRLRAQAYKRGIFQPRRLEGVVISVGNLTVGGTGKTPMVLWIAQRLLAEGKAPGILTRGYRGTPALGRDSTSDEVQLLQARLGEAVRFGVGANRLARGRELVQKGINWFLLDDAFQHQKLARDVDILLIDATNPFGGGHLLPAGRLREPRSALSRADLIVVTRSTHAPAVEAAVRHDSPAPIFYAKSQLESVRRIQPEPAKADDSPSVRTKRLFAFCGIGNPWAFFSDLRAWGFQTVGHKSFPDHHRYTQREVRAMEVEARLLGAEALICTEKDFFNAGNVDWRDFDVFYCRIQMQVDREDEFWQAIMNRAQARIETLR